MLWKIWNFIAILPADFFLYNLLGEKKPKQQILVVLLSNFFKGNKLRPQHQPDHEKVETEHFIMIHDNENTIDSYRWIFNNTAVYSSALSYMTIRNKYILSHDNYAIIQSYCLVPN